MTHSMGVFFEGGGIAQCVWVVWVVSTDWCYMNRDDAVLSLPRFIVVPVLVNTAAKVTYITMTCESFAKI